MESLYNIVEMARMNKSQIKTAATGSAIKLTGWRQRQESSAEQAKKKRRWMRLPRQLS